MYKYTKYKQHINTAVKQNALNKIHTSSCAELVHKSFNLHFSSADKAPSTATKGAGEIPVAKFKAKEIRSRSQRRSLHELQNAWFVDHELFPTHGKSASKAALYALAIFAFLGSAWGLAAEARFIVGWRNL